MGQMESDRMVMSKFGAPHVFCPVGQDDIGTSAVNGSHCFVNDTCFINPSVGRCCFYHTILTRYVVCSQGDTWIVLRDSCNDIQIGQCRFDHQHIRSFLNIEFDFPKCLLSLGRRIHLIGASVSEAWCTFCSIPKRTVIATGVLGCITHDWRYARNQPRPGHFELPESYRPSFR